MGPDLEDVESGLGHEPDIDTAFVVAVHEHHMPVPADQVTVEAQQRRAILGLDHTNDVGVDVADDPGSEPCRQLVGGLYGQLCPTDPVVAAQRGDLHALGLVLRLAVETTPVLA